MKYIKIICIFFLATLSSCGQKSNSGFPNQIKTIKTEKQIRIKGTKVFGVIPTNYQYIKELARYQKADNLYIQVLETKEL